MQRTPAYARVLATVDADTTQWVLKDSGVDVVEDGSAGAAKSPQASAAPPSGSLIKRASLNGTHNVLMKLMSVVPSSSAHMRRAQALVTLTAALLKAFHQGGSAAGEA